MHLLRRSLARLRRFADCNIRQPMRKLFLLSVLAFVLFSCAPQAAYFQVEARDTKGADLNIGGKQVAVFSLAASNKADSTRAANAALGVAEKLGQDRGLDNPLPVFSVSLMEFAGFNGNLGLDKEYLRNLMFSTGADMQIFVENLRFNQFRMESALNYAANYSTNIVSLPYSVDMHIYDALEDSVVFRTSVKDTVYMQLLSDTKPKEYSGFVASKLAEVSAVVGEALGAKLTRQWEMQERMLVNYPDKEAWEKPLAKALDFKWADAVSLWMPLTGSENYRVAAYASYNIAVGCEMMGHFALAREWADFSVKKYRFRENVELVSYLKKRVAND